MYIMKCTCILTLGLIIIQKSVSGRSTVTRIQKDEDGFLTKSNDVFQKEQFSPNDQLYKNAGTEDGSGTRLYDVVVYGAPYFDSLTSSDDLYSSDSNNQATSVDNFAEGTEIPEELSPGYYDTSAKIRGVDTSNVKLPSSNLLNSPFMNPYQLEIPANPQIFRNHQHKFIGLNELPITEDAVGSGFGQEPQEKSQTRRKRGLSLRVLSELTKSVSGRNTEEKLVLNDHADCGRGRRRKPDSGNDSGTVGNTGGADSGTDGGASGGGDGANDDVGADGGTGSGDAEQLRLADSKRNSKRRNAN